jgi:hypothetical protein
VLNGGRLCVNSKGPEYRNEEFGPKMVIYSEIPSRCSKRRFCNQTSRRNPECGPDQRRLVLESDMESGQRAVWHFCSFLYLATSTIMEIGMVSSSTAQRRPPPFSQDAAAEVLHKHAEKEGREEDDDDDDDDDVTVVILDAQYPPSGRSVSSSFINSSLAVDDGGIGVGRRAQQDLQDSLARQQTRRNEMVQELRIVQRSSFRLFLAILVLPVVLLVIAVASVMSDDVDCSGMAPTGPNVDTTSSTNSNSNATAVASQQQSEVVSCWNEQRTFRNAFTTRCICDSVPAGTASTG